MSKRVTITGASGFVGQLIRGDLRRRGHEVHSFDRYRGPMVDLLRRTWLGANAGLEELDRPRKLRKLQAAAERRLAGLGLIRPTVDDILDFRSRLAERFRGSDVVVHLAALPHPNVPGAAEPDYRRINFDGAVNVFEAARDAGVPRFVFASSAQVYGINDPVKIDQFPILETNYLPTREDGQHEYGALKTDFERYLAEACADSNGTRALALRLECPGVLSNAPFNFYASTSIENTGLAFARAIEADLDSPFEAFNVLDGHVDPAIADVQAFLTSEWPGVPNHTEGNESLISIEKARRLLGYEPAREGSYYPLALIWG